MLVVCPKCQAVNRVLAERNQESRPICGKCKTALELRAPGFAIPANDLSFDAEVMRAGVPVLVDFWGPSCPPCRQLEPHLVDLAKELAGTLKVVKVNVEENRAVPEAVGIRSVPTLILYNGAEIARTSGYRALPALREWVQSGLRKARA